MFTRTFFKPKILTLALAMAYAIPAVANDASAADGYLLPAQTWYPSPGVVDSERAHSPASVQVKADYAYSIGVTGKGVAIGLLDTGITIGQGEFSEAGKLLPGYNAVNGGTDVTDRMGHGTHVAGIVGAARDGKGMFGLAYDARLLPIKVFPDSGGATTATLDRGLRYAIGRVAIVNMSLGTTSAYDSRATQDAVRSGLLIVAAAGNTGGANPEWPARFAKEAWANNQIIAVGAVDASNNIASFSNRAGDTAAWFLVAPGVNIPSAWLNQYAYMSGTSMATPVVSGAAALIKQMWPYLHADQIANILFITATDLGAPGIDPVYGRGLLNIEKALQPVGTIKTTKWNGVTIRVLDTSVKPTGATSKLWNLAAAGSLRMVALDDYNRSFSIDLGNSVSRPPSMSLDQMFGSLDRRVEIAERVLADGATLSAAYESRLQSTDALQTAAQRTRLSAFSFVSKQADGMELAFGAGGLASSYFSAVGALNVAALTNPYFALVPSASHAAIAHNFGGDITLRFGWLTSGLNQMLASQEASCTVPAPLGITPRADAALVELSKNFGATALSFSISRTNETNAYLGAQTVGALAFGPSVMTNAAQLAGAWRITSRLALAGQLAYGFTPGGAPNNSLIVDMSATRTNAFAVALVASDHLRYGDRVSLAVSQPMRAYGGSMTLDVVSRVDDNGTEVRERRSFSMAPAAREVMTEVSYRAPAGRDAYAAVALSLRRHPNNLADAGADKLLAMRYMQPF